MKVQHSPREFYLKRSYRAFLRCDFSLIFSAEEKIDQLYVGHFHIMSSGVLPAPNTHKNPSNFPTLVRLAIKSKNLKNKSDFQDLFV